LTVQSLNSQVRAYHQSTETVVISLEVQSQA